VISLLASTFILWVSLWITAGFSIAGILLAVILDAIGFWLALIYLLVLRSYLPELISLKAAADVLMLKHFILPMLAGFFINRICSFVVAKICGYSFTLQSPTIKDEEKPID
jgi:4-hydroxybenzoate polyprenyltransferase